MRTEQMCEDGDDDKGRVDVQGRGSSMRITKFHYPMVRDSPRCRDTSREEEATQNSMNNTIRN